MLCRVSRVRSQANVVQDEFRLLCQVATEKDTSLGAALQQTPGWATLKTILDI
jgi:nuclear protein localization family protein 4